MTTGPGSVVETLKVAAPLLSLVTTYAACPLAVSLERSLSIVSRPTEPAPVLAAVTLTSAFAIALLFVSCNVAVTLIGAPSTGALVFDVANELSARSNLGGQSPAKNAAPLGLPSPDASS